MKWEDNYCYTHNRGFQVLYYPSGAIAYGCPECQQNVKLTVSDRTSIEKEVPWDAEGNAYRGGQEGGAGSEV